MSTIRQRIDAMHKADRLYHKLDYEYPIDDATEEETAALVAATQAADQLDAAIIADWNAAIAAMKRYVAGRYHAEAPSGYRWHCDCCGDGLNRQQGRHNPETCIVAAQQAAIAAMEESE